MNIAVAFDVNGTLSDSFHASINTYNAVRKQLRYPPIAEQEWRENYQTHDFKKLHRDCGISEADVDQVTKLYGKLYQQEDLVPEATRALEIASSLCGQNHVWILSNAPESDLTRLFQKAPHNLLARVRRPKDRRKDTELINIQTESKRRVIYFGDLVADGEMCVVARQLGADVVF